MIFENFKFQISNLFLFSFLHIYVVTSSEILNRLQQITITDKFFRSERRKNEYRKNRFVDYGWNIFNRVRNARRRKFPDGEDQGRGSKAG